MTCELIVSMDQSELKIAFVKLYLKVLLRNRKGPTIQHLLLPVCPLNRPPGAEAVFMLMWWYEPRLHCHIKLVVFLHHSLSGLLPNHWSYQVSLLLTSVGLPPVFSLTVCWWCAAGLLSPCYVCFASALSLFGRDARHLDI